VPELNEQARPVARIDERRDGLAHDIGRSAAEDLLDVGADPVDPPARVDRSEHDDIAAVGGASHHAQPPVTTDLLHAFRRAQRIGKLWNDVAPIPDDPEIARVEYRSIGVAVDSNDGAGGANSDHVVRVAG
jgi:hypothetical protein